MPLHTASSAKAIDTESSRAWSINDGICFFELALAHEDCTLDLHPASSAKAIDTESSQAWNINDGTCFFELALAPEDCTMDLLLAREDSVPIALAHGIECHHVPFQGYSGLFFEHFQWDVLHLASGSKHPKVAR